MGLTRHAGTYDVLARHDLTLFEDGRFEGRSNGKIQVRFQPIDVDVGYTLSADGDVTLLGQLETPLGHSAGAVGGKPVSRQRAVGRA